MQYQRRHSRWYERLLLSIPLQFVGGLLVVVYLPTIYLQGLHFWLNMPITVLSSITSAIVAYFVAFLILYRVDKFSATGTLSYVLPVVSVVFFVILAILFFTRSKYARALLLLSYVLMLLWFYAGYVLGKRYRRRKLAFLPMKRSIKVSKSHKNDIHFLRKPDLEGVRYDGIVADLRSKSMTPEWEAFLADCILAHIPVFHVRTVLEEMTGRVELDYLLENHVGALLPSPLYTGFKHVFDVVCVLALLPIALPLMLVIALVIRLESKGPAIFVQQRVGMSGKIFRMYKFRSMKSSTNRRVIPPTEQDARITRVGRFLRKMRLDELPQFFNILKGDMSLIGPRPETSQLVRSYEKEIPFYKYRHVVRPGISGWAQVTQGYVADTVDTRIKIQHDFYYIKHFSLWLDILIAFKTIRVMLSGFGAR